MVRRVLLGLFLASMMACTRGAEFEGRVVDKLGRVPVPEAVVTARTSSDIKSEQPYTQLTTQSDHVGVFRIRHALPGHAYSFHVSKQGLSAADGSQLAPAEGETRMIGQFEIYAIPPSKGIFIKAAQDFIPAPSVPIDYLIIFTSTVAGPSTTVVRSQIWCSTI
jgi:hypothetical protein